MLALGTTSCKAGLTSSKPVVSARYTGVSTLGRRSNTSKSRRFLRKPAFGNGKSLETTPALQATPENSELGTSDVTSALAKRAALIAKRLIQQREHISDVPSGATASRDPLDQSLTSLLTSLLATLADTATPNTPEATPRNTIPLKTFNEAPGDKPTPNPTTSLSDGLVQLLTAWADEFLTLEGTPSATFSEKTLSETRSPPATPKVPGSSPTDPKNLAKTLFMQLLAELLPPAEGSVGATVQPSVGRGLLAATAAAVTARETASRLAQWLQEPTAAAGTAGRTPRPIKVRASSTTDSFDPDAWEATARAAAAAAQAEVWDAALTADSAAAAVASNTTSFCPDAWELSAAAACAAAAAGVEQAGPDRSASKPPLPEPCWAVHALAEALQTAVAAALKYSQRTAGSTAAASARGPSSTTDGTDSPIPAVQELLLLPASEAVQMLLQLPAVHRAGLLLLLCGASEVQGSTATTTDTKPVTGSGVAGLGSRGEAWLLMVLEGVRPQLGLLEMGALLAAVHNRYGDTVFLKACTTLLPLTDTTDSHQTLAPASAPPPAAALQALLLHWLLQPQLSAAGLPLLPEVRLLQLLPQVVAGSSSRQLTAAAHWGSVWPLTALHEATSDGVHSSSSSRGGGWDVIEPHLDSVLVSQAWCGLTGVPLVWVAHVAAAAAAKLIHGTSTSSCSSSAHSAQLSAGTAAAAYDARAILGALIRGLQPAEPLVLLLMHAVQSLQPGLAGLAAGSTAEAAWKQQLQHLLLEAYSGTTLPFASLADIIHRGMCCMWTAGNAENAASCDVSVVSVQQQQVLDAAAALLASLPPQQLQQELQALLALHEAATPGSKLAAGPQATQHQAALCSMLAATAAAAEPAQAAAMLAALPMPYFADVWAVFVSPTAGCFCWNRQQLAATLLGIVSPAAAAAGSSVSSSWGKLTAAWGVVAAHFKLQAVVQEVACRPTAATPSSSSSSSSGAAVPSYAPGSKPFNDAVPYQYTPGLPFIGDTWDQAPAAAAAAGKPATPVACFAGSLGDFLCEVLAQAPLPVAAAHIAAVSEVLPTQAFARVAAVLVPRLVNALDNMEYTTYVSQGSTSTAAAAGAQGWMRSTTVVGTPGLQGLSKGLLKLYGSISELPDAPWAMQLLAVAAPVLPLDLLPQLITTAGQLAPQLKHMPWVPGADISSSNDSAPELSTVEQLELVVAAAATGRDSMALQHMLGMLVRQLPLKEAHVAFRVLQGVSATAQPYQGVSATAKPYRQLPYAAVEEASSVLRQRCADAAAASAAVSGRQDRRVSSTAPFRSSSSSSSSRSVKSPWDEEVTEGGAGDVVWQLGQSAAAAAAPAAAQQALGSYVHNWGSADTAASSSGSSTAGAASFDDDDDVFSADRELVRRLSDVVSDIPAAPPAGSWAMDAMHSPTYTAPLLKRCLALLVDWTPSCPSAAALVAQQLNLLAQKRAWSAAEAAAVLQRLPLNTALQLLLESGPSSSSSSSSSGGGSKRQLLLQLRPKLLRALVDWQGSEAVTQGFRELAVGYKGQGAVSFVEVMSDLRLALSGPGMRYDSSSSSSGGGLGLTVAPTAAPTAYTAALLAVLDVLMPGLSSSSSKWSQDLAQALVLLSPQVPEAAVAKLAEQIGRDLADVSSQQKPGKSAAAATASAATAAWQADVSSVLAALPAAAAANTASKQGQHWGAIAVAMATGVAEAAGSSAVLQCIRSTLQYAVHDTIGSTPSTTAWAAELAPVLGQLQQQGVLTCGVAYASLTSSSSSMGSRFSSNSSSSSTPSPVTPSCISLQLLQLLQDVYLTDGTVSLQQAAAAVISVQDGLGKALPMAVASVLGGGACRNARGFSATGPDAADVSAALDTATAEVVGRYQPTAAALPAATATAAKQLSETLVRCHELLPDHVMAALMAALAAVLPWTDVQAAAAAGSGSNGGSSGGSSVTCPAEVQLAQGGWSGVTQVLLITSTLLTASYRVWGVDKGTHVAASLIQKLTTPAVTGTAAAAAGDYKTKQGPQLSRSASDGALLHHGSSSSGSTLRHAASTGSIVGIAESSSSSSSSSSSTSSSRVSSSSNSSHAVRAEAALLKATSSGTDSHKQAGVASHRPSAAAATGGNAPPGSHASTAAAALRNAASSSSSSSSSHANLAEGKLLHAAVSTGGGGGAVPGSHAARAKAALLQGAASGLSTPPHSAGAATAAAAADGHAQRAQNALLQALAGGSNPSAAAAAAGSGSGDAGEVAWGSAQLLSAADAYLWPGLTSAQGLVRGILYPKYYSPTKAQTTELGGASAGAEVACQFAVKAPSEAAAALVVALPGLCAELPPVLTAEVLARTWGLVPSTAWATCFQTVVSAAAATANEATGGVTDGSQAWDTVLQMLQAAVSSMQQYLEASRELPVACAAILSTAARLLPEDTFQQLLQQVVHGSGAKGGCLESEGYAQLLRELSRPLGDTSASSSSSSAQTLSAKQQQQLLLVAAVADQIFAPTAESNNDIIPADVAADLAGRLYQADLLPRTYLTLLLLPHLDTPLLQVCVKQLGLSCGDTPAAAAALQDLCNNLHPGRKLPLASYAQLLAAALEDTVSTGFSGVTFHEARVGLELERQQRLQQLLAAVVHVLGTFRGMRRLHTSPLGAQLLLPMYDLAAVMCYSWQLLPSDAARKLAAAVAAALAELQGSELQTALQLLPNAAAEGFGKGPELWQPLLHVMAVAGVMSDAQESSLTQQLLAVAAQKKAVASHPLQLEDDSSYAATAQGTAAVGGTVGGLRMDGNGFADPASVSAALDRAAAINEVGLSAGRVSRRTASGHTTAAAAATKAAAAAAGDAEAAGADEELSEADAALLAAGAAAYMMAALTGFNPISVIVGSVGTLLVAALGTAQQLQQQEQQQKVTPDAPSSSSSSSSSSSQPPSPRTPTTRDTASSTVRRPGHTTMGGRTKVSFAEPSTDSTKASADAAAVLGYAAAATAAAAAAAAGRGGVVGLGALGSLAVDPDDVIKKIKGQSAQLPLDEALMEVVPLLLLPSDASSHTWPLLGLSAILHSKIPRLHTLLGPGGSPLINMALAATLVNPDGPLAAVMNASELLADAEANNSSSSSGPVKRELLAALAAAEAVHPHAVAMQLAERLLNALWAVLTGHVASMDRSNSSSSSMTRVSAAGAAGVGTPEGAAAAWQQIVTQLLSGVDSKTAVKLLAGFAHRQQGIWEAQLQALAVAAAMQHHTHSSSSSSSSSSGLLPELLGEVCAANNYPPVSFLSMLLHTTAVPLAPGDTAAVLAAALAQLTSAYGIALPAAAAGSTTTSSSSSRGSLTLQDGVGTSGEFDSWGLDALAGVQGLLGDRVLGEALKGFGSSNGPQYQATSSFKTNSSNSSSSGFAAVRKLSAVPASVLGLIESLVKGACARGHYAEALAFLTQLLHVTHCRTAALPQNMGLDQQGAASAGGLQGVLVVERDQEQQLLQLVELAVDSSCTSSSSTPEDNDQAKETSVQGVASSSMATGATAVRMSSVLTVLVDVLAGKGHLGCVNQVITAVCHAFAQQYIPNDVQYNTANGTYRSSSSSSSNWVSAEVVGQVLTLAAEGVRKSEGVLSAAKPGGAVFLATAADALFGDRAVSVEWCLVVLAAVAGHMPMKLGLQIVAAAAGRLHSVMPQAVAVVRQVGLAE